MSNSACFQQVLTGTNPSARQSSRKYSLVCSASSQVNTAAISPENHHSHITGVSRPMADLCKPTQRKYGTTVSVSLRAILMPSSWMKKKTAIECIVRFCALYRCPSKPIGSSVPIAETSSRRIATSPTKMETMCQNERVINVCWRDETIAHDYA
jgi:hypothetical protein